MDLLLWRHAEAVDSMPDHARVLTEKGIKQAEKMAGFLRQKLPDDCHMLSSPATRTQQTISTLSSHFTVAPALAPGSFSPGCTTDCALAKHQRHGAGCRTSTHLGSSSCTPARL